MKSEVQIAKKAGKNLGKLVRIAKSNHAPTILAFFEKGAVAVAIGSKKAVVTNY